MKTTAQTNTSAAMDTAYSIGRKLCKEAIWRGEECTWQGAAVIEENGQSLLVNRTFGTDLHGGLAGIALFLAELAVEVDDAVLETTLNGAVKNLLKQLEGLKREPDIGFYFGLSGVGYALWRMGKLRSDQTWLNAGLGCFDVLKNAEIATAQLDLVSGLAGAIPVFLKLYKETEREDLLDLARQCGDQLLAVAIKEEEYWCWQTLLGETALTGYGYGAAGIALAFQELAGYTDDGSYKEAAFYGFAYENAHFDARQNNWFDLRYSVRNRQTADGQPGCSDSWCHGAPGIALSRLRAYELTGNVDFLQEARLGLDTTCELVSAHLKNPSQANYSLCQGLAGNADILMQGSRVLDEPVYAQVAQQVAKLGRMLYDHTDSDWPSGVVPPMGVPHGKYPTPGLMLGLAGTGLFYLRLSENRRPENLLMIT